MLTITINDRHVRDYLEALYGRTKDFSPAMADIGQELESRVRARFETETDPSGHPWARWAPSTAASYPRSGTKSKYGAGHGRILERYGDMLKSLNWQSDATSARVGFGVRYAEYHEHGTSRMRRRGLLYADPVAKTLAPDDIQYVLDVINQHLMQP